MRAVLTHVDDAPVFLAPSSSEIKPQPRTSALQRRPAAERRRVYIGEGLTVRFSVGTTRVSGEIIDLGPEGLGIAVMDAGAVLPSEGERITLVHTGQRTSGLSHQVTITHLGQGTFSGRKLPRIDVSFAPESTFDPTVNQRNGERYSTPRSFPILVSAESPLFFREWLHFTVREIGPRGMSLTTSTRNKGLIPGLRLNFDVTLPVIGTFSVSAHITHIRRNGNREYALGVALDQFPKAFAHGLSEYLMLGEKALTPAELRDSGFAVGNVDRAVTYEYAHRPHDYEEILALRLKAHQAEGRHQNLTPADNASSFDAHSRHLVCRFGGEIVGYVRANYVGTDRAKSQYAIQGGHTFPDWLWEAGFVEGGAGAVHPDFQRCGILHRILQHMIRVTAQSGYRYFVAACDESLAHSYHSMGFTPLESKTVCPRPGWEFTSHLFVLDLQSIVDSEALLGKTASGLADAARFAGLRESAA